MTMHPILVFTDHNPLTFIHKMRNKNQRLTRWSLMLQEYDVIIRHIKGKDNVIADALSRSFIVINCLLLYCFSNLRKFSIFSNFSYGGR